MTYGLCGLVNLLTFTMTALRPANRPLSTSTTLPLFINRPIVATKHNMIVLISKEEEYWIISYTDSWNGCRGTAYDDISIKLLSESQASLTIQHHHHYTNSNVTPFLLSYIVHSVSETTGRRTESDNRRQSPPESGCVTQVSNWVCVTDRGQVWTSKKTGSVECILYPA